MVDQRKAAKNNWGSMRDLSELSEQEADLVNGLITAYSAAIGYSLDRDPPVHEVAKELIEEGRVGFPRDHRRQRPGDRRLYQGDHDQLPADR